MRTMTTWSILLLMVGAFAFAGGAQEEAAEAAETPDVTESQGPVEIEFWTTQTQSDRQATIQVLVDTF
ncbi:MAG: hypothetical protein ACOCYQ_09545, partial [Alkalispirochaeta sp.]